VSARPFSACPPCTEKSSSSATSRKPVMKKPHPLSTAP
jgi:hypothetical protein